MSLSILFFLFPLSFSEPLPTFIKMAISLSNDLRFHQRELSHWRDRSNVVNNATFVLMHSVLIVLAIYKNSLRLVSNPRSTVTRDRLATLPLTASIGLPSGCLTSLRHSLTALWNAKNNNGRKFQFMVPLTYCWKRSTKFMTRILLYFILSVMFKVIRDQW